MLKRRIAMSLFGVIICAIAVGIFKIAALGVDPFQSLMSGLDKLIPIEFGTLYVIVNAILLIFSLIADRHNIGIATFINCFCWGTSPNLPTNICRLCCRTPPWGCGRCVCSSASWSSASARRST